MSILVPLYAGLLSGFGVLFLLDESFERRAVCVIARFQASIRSHTQTGMLEYTGFFKGLADKFLSKFAFYHRAQERATQENRRDACLWQLPVCLDVVTLCMSAGLSFDAALSWYCSRYSQELAQALYEARMTWQLGVMSREDALQRVADELDSPAFQRFASTVSESLAFGTPLSSALEHQADLIRNESRSQVEERIEKIPVKMLIPLGTLIVPAMLIAILGPLAAAAAQTA